MKAFMDKDFLLKTPTAQHLYHDYSRQAAHRRLSLPHCPRRRFTRTSRFENIAQVSGCGRCSDHYKWRVMRANGVPEEYITGDKPRPRALPEVCREPWPWPSATRCTHWCHLELKQLLWL